MEPFDNADATPVNPLRPSLPGDETAAFMARMDAINAADEGVGRRRLFRGWHPVWLVTVGFTVALIVGLVVL